MSTVPVQNDHDDHDSHHEEELHHGEPGPLRSPTFPRRAIRSASTSSATLEDAPGYQANRGQGQPKLNLTTIPAGSTTNTMSTLNQPNRTPQYIPASPSALAAPLALSRSTSRSRPPVVGPFGGVSPDDDDGEGYAPVRSQEEADARDLRREMSRQMSRQASRQSGSRGMGAGGVGIVGGHASAPVESPTSMTGALPPMNNGPPSPTAHRSALPGRQPSGYIGSGSQPLRQRSRGQSLIGTVADLATAGFGLGEPNEQIVQRTLSRVSTRRGGSQYPIGGGLGGTIEEKREREREEDRQSGSERTVVDATGPDAHHEKAVQGQGTDAAVGQFGGTTGGGAVNAQRMADLEKGARPGEDAPAESDASTPVDEKDEDELYMVKFEPGEKANPKNWSVAYRWYLTGAGGLLVLNSTFASSAPSGIAEDMIEYFGFSREVAILTIALFVAGYCVGPLLWGPMSESYGRRPVFIVAFLGYIGFQVGCALSKNTASILVFRFLGGTFASCPLTNAGALLADIWGPDHRGQAMAIFSLAPFAGPAIGPIVGGYIGVSGASWRWLYWVLTMFAGVCGLVVLFGIPETYTPILLVKKAGILRKETGDDRWWAPLERKDKDFKSVVQDVLVKPFKILALEPMLIAITVYMSFVYGCIYLLFEAYPIVFQQGHGFNSGASGLMFLGLFIGGVCGVIFFISIFEKRYRRHVQEYAPAMVPPEKRLHATLVAAPLLAISFFWFGWTSYPSIHWISPCMAGGLLGFAVLLIFVTLFNYIVDTYLFAAASALSANTVCRSLFGASFPLFASQMFDALNPRWASTLLGCVAVIMVPIPFVLIKFGPTLRAKSRFSPSKK